MPPLANSRPFKFHIKVDTYKFILKSQIYVPTTTVILNEMHVFTVYGLQRVYTYVTCGKDNYFYDYTPLYCIAGYF